MLQTLRKTSMFSGLSGELLETIVSGCRLIPLKKGEYLFHDGEQASGFYVVHNGAVNVHRVSSEGKEQVIRVFYPGEAFGEVVLAEGAHYPASAVAIESTQVILISRSFFRECIHQDPDLALRILASMSLHLKYLVETTEDLKLKQAESRVAQWLLRQSRDSRTKPPVITLPMTKRLLASQLGITSETFSRVLARLREEELIQVEGKAITLLSPDALNDYLLRDR